MAASIGEGSVKSVCKNISLANGGVTAHYGSLVSYHSLARENSSAPASRKQHPSLPTSDMSRFMELPKTQIRGPKSWAKS